MAVWLGIKHILAISSVQMLNMILESHCFTTGGFNFISHQPLQPTFRVISKSIEQLVYHISHVVGKFTSQITFLFDFWNLKILKIGQKTHIISFPMLASLYFCLLAKSMHPHQNSRRWSFKLNSPISFLIFSCFNPLVFLVHRVQSLFFGSSP